MTYEWECQQCGNVTAINRPMAERDVPPAEDCDACRLERTEWKRHISVPNFTRKTFIDGGRKSDQNFQDAKRALQLEVDSARSNSADDKKQMSQEIKRLRSTKP